MGKITSSIVRALIAMAIVVIIASAALAWRLAAGPVSLAFLTPYLEDALNRGHDEDVSVRLGSTMLTWAGWRRTLDIRARDVVIADRDGIVIAELPEISIGLSGRALLESQLRPSSIDVLGAEAVIIRHSDETIALGFGEASVQGESNALLSRYLSEILVPPDAAPNTGALARVSILDSNLTFIDQVNGALWRAPKADLVLLRRGQLIEGDARLEIDFGGRRSEVAGTISYDSVSGRAHVRVLFDDVHLPDIAKQGRALALLNGIEVPIGGSMQLAIGSDGHVSDATFSVTGDSGFVDLPSNFDERLPVVRATVHGTYAWDQRQATIDELAIDLGGTLITARGVARLVNADPEFIGDIRILDLPIARLPAYWPRGLATDARQWVKTRIEGGRISEATFSVGRGNQPAGEPDIEVDFAFAGASVSVIRELPPATNASGRGRIAEDRLDVSVESAVVDGIDLSEVVVVISDISAPTQTAEVDFVLRGTLPQVLGLLDSPPFGIASDLGVPVSGVGGAIAARAHVTIPLTEQGTPPDSVNFAAAANLADVSGALASPPLTFDRGTLSLRLDREGFDIDGALFVVGTPTTLQWRQDFDRENGGSSRFLLRAQIDEAGRKRLGVGTGSVIDGFVDVSVDVAAARGVPERVVVDVNFLGAAIELPTLHWRKASESPGRGRAVIVPQTDGSLIVESLEFRAADMIADGQLELDSALAVRRFDLSRLTFGRSDLSISVRPRAPSGFIVALDGRRMDFGPYLTDMLDPSDGDPLPPLEVSLRVDELAIGESESLKGLVGRASYDGTMWSDIAVNGKFGADNKPLSFVLSSDNGVRSLDLRSADAGSVAQAIGVYDNAEGGELVLSAIVDDNQPNSPIKGTIRIREFTLVRAPTLTRILTLASLEGVRELLSGGQGISFVGLDMPFELSNGDLRISEARAFGPALGITADGTYSLTTEQADFAGTIVPAYTVNSLLGNIPVLGNLLVGRKGEGVFALTYTARGKFDTPEVQVNPLSALAPGFLRRLVTLLDGQSRPSEEDVAE